jgi:hypothetical protein
MLLLRSRQFPSGDIVLVLVATAQAKNHHSNRAGQLPFCLKNQAGLLAVKSARVHYGFAEEC